MPWAVIDDKLHGNEKFAEAGLEAAGLWLLCLAWASDNLTDGKLSRVMVERMGGPRAKKLTKALLDVGLWETREEGEIWIHNYLKYNPSRAEVEAKRAAAKERMQAKRGAKKPARSEEIPGSFDDCSREQDANLPGSSQPVPIPPTHTPPLPIPDIDSAEINLPTDPGGVGGRSVGVPVDFLNGWSPGDLLGWFQKQRIYPLWKDHLAAQIAKAPHAVQDQAAYLRPVILRIVAGEEPVPVGPARASPGRSNKPRRMTPEEAEAKIDATIDEINALYGGQYAGGS